MVKHSEQAEMFTMRVCHFESAHDKPSEWMHDGHDPWSLDGLRVGFCRVDAQISLPIIIIAVRRA